MGNEREAAILGTPERLLHVGGGGGHVVLRRLAIASCHSAPRGIAAFSAFTPSLSRLFFLGGGFQERKAAVISHSLQFVPENSPLHLSECVHSIKQSAISVSEMHKTGFYLHFTGENIGDFVCLSSIITKTSVLKTFPLRLLHIFQQILFFPKLSALAADF